MLYSSELKKAMELLAKNPRTIFLGQAVAYPGHNLNKSLIDIPIEKRLEMPVAEDLQMGMTIGLALEGFIPISIYPRMDFIILACNQLVNHLDKIPILTKGKTNPIAIIRVAVGSKIPLYPGAQHCQDHTAALESMCQTIQIKKLYYAKDIVPAYAEALNSNKPSLLIEYGDRYDTN